eukprot:gene38688-28097_t
MRRLSTDEKEVPLVVLPPKIAERPLDNVVDDMHGPRFNSDPPPREETGLRRSLKRPDSPRNESLQVPPSPVRSVTFSRAQPKREEGTGSGELKGEEDAEPTAEQVEGRAVGPSSSRALLAQVEDAIELTKREDTGGPPTRDD